MATTQAINVKRINVRLKEPLAERLAKISEDLGLTPATIGALAIAQYVKSHEQQETLPPESKAS